MIKFIHFLKKIYFPLVFIILEALAIHFYAGSSAYTKVKLLTVSNSMAGGVYSQLSAVNSYFHLRKENRSLAEENSRLKNMLDSRMASAGEDTVAVDSASIIALVDPLSVERKYEYFSARVEDNTIIHQQNTITLDKGTRDGIEPNMGVISDGAVVGYVAGCTEKFSICISVLNTDFRTSGKLKGSDYSGSVYWDGRSWESVVLTEVPKYADISVGDTILTTEYSDKFPPDIMIGTVESFELKNLTYYDIRVKLHANMAAISNVTVVKYLDGKEKLRLQEIINEMQ